MEEAPEAGLRQLDLCPEADEKPTDVLEPGGGNIAMKALGMMHMGGLLGRRVANQGCPWQCCSRPGQGQTLLKQNLSVKLNCKSNAYS